MAVELEVRREDAMIRTRPRLEGTRFKVELKWNVRERQWGFAMYSMSHVLLTARPVASGENMLDTRPSEELPLGALIVLDTTNSGEEPGRRAWADGTFKLVYLTAAEIGR